MTPEHPSDLNLYVMGALTLDRERSIEEHLDACADCAASLAREARLELSLPEVAVAAAARPSPSRDSRRWRPRRLAACALAAAAMAVAVLLVVNRWPGRALGAPDPLSYTCITPSPECFEEMARHGRFPEDFPAQVPRYEMDPATAPAAGGIPPIGGLR